MRNLIVFFFFAVLAFTNGFAQDGAKSLASTLEVYVFPEEGQEADLQSIDEAECYSWAVNNVGSDPFDLQKQAEQQQQQTEQQVQQAQSATQGAGARGAVRGAAAGAAIGAIADEDKSDAAATGAAVGAIAARRRSRAASAQAQEQAQQQGAAQQQATAEQAENFKKAFSVCLEAKDYLVRY